MVQPPDRQDPAKADADGWDAGQAEVQTHVSARTRQAMAELLSAALAADLETSEQSQQALAQSLIAFERLGSEGELDPAVLRNEVDKLWARHEHGFFGILGLQLSLALQLFHLGDPDTAASVVDEAMRWMATLDFDELDPDSRVASEVVSASIAIVSDLLGLWEEGTGGPVPSDVEFQTIVGRGLGDGSLSRLVRQSFDERLWVEAAIEAFKTSSADATELLDLATQSNVDPSVRASAFLAVGRELVDGDPGQARPLLEAAYRLARPMVSGGQTAASAAFLLFGLDHHANTADSARAWFDLGVQALQRMRNAAADPLVRLHYLDDSFWMDAALSDIFALGDLSRLGELMRGFSEHGLAALVGGLPATSDGGPERAIRAAMAQSWPSAGIPETDMPLVTPGEALLHVAIVDVGAGNTEVISHLQTHGAITATQTPLPQRLRRLILDPTVARIRQMRDRDWIDLAHSVLPNGLPVDSHSLCIIPIGQAGVIPYGHLPVGPTRLQDEIDLHVAPSHALWRELPEVAIELRRAVVLGQDTTEHPDGVAGLLDEIASLNAAGVHVVRVSTLDELADALANTDLLVLSVHGFVSDRRNLLLVPGLGAIDASELALLRLPPLLVAGACWSGTHQSIAAPFALLPAALAGGARAVVTMLWDADARDASATLSRFYRELAQNGAVRRAWSRARASGGSRDPDGLELIGR